MSPFPRIEINDALKSKSGGFKKIMNGNILLNDITTYYGCDSGCCMATSYLGYPSSCLYNCSFKICTKAMSQSEILKLDLEVKRKMRAVIYRQVYTQEQDTKNQTDILCQLPCSPGIWGIPEVSGFTDIAGVS